MKKKCDFCSKQIKGRRNFISIENRFKKRKNVVCDECKLCDSIFDTKIYLIKI